MDDSDFGNDRRDEFRRRDIESRIVNLDIHRCGPFSKCSGDFLGFALFDRNIRPIDNRKIEGARRSRNQKWYLVMLGQNG